MTTLVVTRHIAVHNSTTPVHGCYSIAAEWMHGKLETFLLGMMLLEEYILRSKHSLTRYIIREHAFPTTWQSTSMEDNLQTIIVGIAKDILVQLHNMLLVATEEVNLYAFDAYRLHPPHLLFTCNYRVHTVAWSLRSLISRTVAVVPQH